MGKLRIWSQTKGHSYYYRYKKVMGFFRESTTLGKTALEVGCNDGTFAAGLAKLGYQVTAIDTIINIDPLNLHKNVKYVKGNLWDSSLNSSTFDIVHLGQVVEHVEEPDQFMLRVLRLCKPRAKIFFSVPNFGGSGHKRTYNFHTAETFASNYIDIEGKVIFRHTHRINANRWFCFWGYLRNTEIDKKPLRILYLYPNEVNRYNFGHNTWAITIARNHDVILYGPGYPGYDSDLPVKNVINKFYGSQKPDVIFLYNLKRAKKFKGLKDVDIPKCMILIDTCYWKEERAKWIKENKINVCFFRYKDDMFEFEKRFKGITNCRWFPFSFDDKIFRDFGLERNIDIGFFGSLIPKNNYSFRNKMVNIVLNEFKKNYNCQIAKPKQFVHLDYARALASTKILFNCSCQFRYLNQKYFESLACGTLLIADRPKNGFEDIFGNGDDYMVLVKSEKDFREKLKYYLKNASEGREIAKNGFRFVHAKHTHSVRLKEWQETMNEFL